MDLTERQCDRELRADVRRFLDEKLSDRLKEAGRLMTSIFADFEVSQEWHALLYERGWAAPTWPTEFGGAGWDLGQYAVFLNEMARAGAPPPYPIGIQMLGPVLIRYGTARQKAELLPRILSGEDIWCQGYSEPNAGSDLASLATRAERVDDTYVVDGSKIWTSMAHRANKIFCLVRTGATERPQQGISFLLIDLDTPGITVSEIVSLDGEVEQCQVFFEGVVVPAGNLVGEENDGWSIAKYLLDHERGGYSYHSSIERQLEHLRAAPLASACDDAQLLAAREAELEACEVDKLALQFTEYRIQAARHMGAAASAFDSMAKIAGNELGQRLDSIGLEQCGSYIALKQNAALSPGFEGDVIGMRSRVPAANRYLNNRASTIYGGSSQVQRNIIASQLFKADGELSL